MDRLCRPGRRAERVLTLLASLEDVGDGGAISELDHALQLATRAERAGADEDVVLAGLLHDIGKVFGDAGHGAVAAALLEPHVRSDVVQVVRHHSIFTARHWEQIPAGEPDPRDQFAEEPWFGFACRFVDEWDVRSFDPTYDSLPLDHFIPMVQRRVREP